MQDDEQISNGRRYVLLARKSDWGVSYYAMKSRCLTPDKGSGRYASASQLGLHLTAGALVRTIDPGCSCEPRCESVCFLTFEKRCTSQSDMGRERVGTDTEWYAALHWLPNFRAHLDGLWVCADDLCAIDQRNVPLLSVHGPQAVTEST